ncbi:Ig-like domain-containing protein, partial [uncultured Bradyrhizobium sp.]|uniref:VCBS domain-containing protein n=1 Tax=uncultured Bradyrhizobium sp. TaxID=199684 RepID=UPI002639B785
MDRRAVSEDNILLDPVQRFAGAGMPPYGSEQVLDFVQARAAASGEDSDLVARGRNGPPVARDDTNGGDAVIEAGRGVPGDAVAKGNVLSNDSDPDFDPLTVSKTGKFHGEFGTLSLSARGQWVYHLDNSDPDTDALAKGEKVVDAFKYTVNDSFVG